jgi:DNA helicase-2/ATP-dependent DNA helicase PcrA
MNNPDFETNFNVEYLKLNAQQKLAVDTIDGPVMVIAGAGTGKTQVIALRIAQILRETDLNPNNILCMTFTEAGVSAMRERLMKIIGSEAYKVKVCTFHAFCNEVIASHPEKFPQVNKEGEAISEVEKVRLLLKLIDELDVNSPLRPFAKQDMYLGEIKYLISKLKRDYVHPEEYAQEVEKNYQFYVATKDALNAIKAIHYSKIENKDFLELLTKLQAVKHLNAGFVDYLEQLTQNCLVSDFDAKEAKKMRTKLRREMVDLYQKNFDDYILQKQKDFAQIYQRFQEEMLKAMKYDYDDMIIFTVDAFKQDKNLLNEYQELYQYILLDEYQDTNAAQNEAVFQLGSFFPNPNIFVVGDDDQSIYKFQGANTQNIFAFKERFQDYIQIITLKNNYRSQQMILDAAASMIEHNETRLTTLIEGIDKNLLAQAGHEIRPLEINQYLTAEQELYGISQNIEGLLAKGVPKKEIAVLARDNKDIGLVKEYLAKAGIPSSKDIGEDIMESVYLKQFLYLLKYLIDPLDDQSLFRFLSANFVGLAVVDLIKLNTFAYQSRIPLSSLVIEPQERINALGLKNEERVWQVFTQLQDWRQRVQNSKAVIIFSELLEETNYLKFILTQPDSVSEMGKINRLYQELKNLAIKDQDYSLQNFVDDLELYKTYDIDLIDSQSNLVQDKVRVMTAHGSKGLEFDYVFLYNCVDKKWSNSSNRERIRSPLAVTGKIVSLTENEEERRLFYVALTRARKHVTITYHVHSEASKSAKQPAQYIQEIKPDFLIQQKYDQEEQLKAALNFALAHGNVLNLAQEARDLLQANLSTMRFSITHINSYLKCPRCFFYKTILRIPQLRTESQAMGTAIHETFKYIQIELNNSGLIPSIAEVHNKYSSYLAKEFLSREQYENTLQKGRVILEYYITNNRQSFIQGTLTEKNMGVYNIIWEGIPLTGKIDSIEFAGSDQKNVIVTDFKTGNPDTKSAELSQKSLGDYYRQLLFYKLLIDNVPSLNWNTNKGRISFVEKSRDQNAIISREFELMESDYLRLKDIVKDVYAKVMNFEFDDCGQKCDNHELHELNLQY